MNVYGQGAYKVGKQIVREGRTRSIPDVKLPPGEWVQVSAIIPGTDEPVKDLSLSVVFADFPPGSIVYVDDVFVAELPGLAVGNNEQE